MTTAVPPDARQHGFGARTALGPLKNPVHCGEEIMADWDKAAEQIDQILAAVQQLDDKLETMWGRKRAAKPSNDDPAAEHAKVVAKARDDVFITLGSRYFNMKERLTKLEQRVEALEARQP
jgi:hypothetical protein